MAISSIKKLVLGVASVAIVIGTVFLIRYLGNGSVTPVKTVVAEMGAVKAFTLANGNVLNRDELTLSSPVQAQILKLGAFEGEMVAKGKVLAYFDERDQAVQIDQAIAVLKLAESRQEQAKQELRLLKEIFELGGESRKTVEDAELRWQVTLKEAQVANNDLRLKRIQIESFQLKAPVDGVITIRTARVGAWVKPGDTLFKLSPAGNREIEVRLDAGDSAAATVGENVAVTSDAYPGKEWNEKITWVAPATTKEGSGNSLNVRISISQDAPPLILGQQADVKILTASRDNVLKIPSRAIISKKGKSLVATIRNGRVFFVPIITDIEDLTHTEVKSGLRAGDRVILPEGKILRKGDQVLPIPDKGT